MNEINPSAYSAKIDYSDVIHVTSTKQKTKGILFRIVILLGIALFVFVMVYSIYSTSNSINDLERINAQMNEELKLSKVEIEKKQNMLNEMDKDIKTFEEKISELDKEIPEINRQIAEIQNENKKIKEQIEKIEGVK